MHGKNYKQNSRLKSSQFLFINKPSGPDWFKSGLTEKCGTWKAISGQCAFREPRKVLCEGTSRPPAAGTPPAGRQGRRSVTFHAEEFQTLASLNLAFLVAASLQGQGHVGGLSLLQMPSKVAIQLVLRVQARGSSRHRSRMRGWVGLFHSCHTISHNKCTYITNPVFSCIFWKATVFRKYSTLRWFILFS